MSVTTIAPAENMTGRGDRRTSAILDRLGDWMPEARLFDFVAEAFAMPRSDRAALRAFVTGLVSAEQIEWRPGADGKEWRRRPDAPPLTPRPRIGTPEYNAALLRSSEAERQVLDSTDVARFANPARREFDAAVRAAVDQRLRELGLLPNLQEAS